MRFEPVLRVAEVRAVEAAATAAAPLMERAGVAGAEVARAMMLAGGPSRVVVLAGPGNNGGDAFVVARWLRRWFFDVDVAFHGDIARLPRDAAAAHQAWRAAGGSIADSWSADQSVGLIVDGLFGIGLARPATGAYSEWIDRANASAAPVLALDIPSGLDADSGVAHAPTVRATATATFIAHKPGLLTLDGPDCCGEISIHRLGLDDQVASVARGERIGWGTMRSTLPSALKRGRHNVHKGSFGALAIVGGSDGMVGAALLAGRAALYLGAGKVFVGLASEAPPAADWLQPELMLRRAELLMDIPVDAIVIGPGLGTDERARRLLTRFLVQSVALVIDADALNLIAAHADLRAAASARSAPTVITPHPAEAARLAGTTTSMVQADRLSAALSLASELNAAVVVKGAGSILAFPDGRWAINASGNAGLASAGTGDVLAGMIGALLAQGTPVADALKCAVCLHGAAADMLVAQGTGPLGLTASELAPMARRLINRADTQDV